MPTTIQRETIVPPSDAATAGELAKSFVVPLGSRSYSKQYAQLYDYRLAYLKKRILPRAKARWVDNFESFSQSQSQPSSQLDTSDAGPSSPRLRMQDPPKLVRSNPRRTQFRDSHADHECPRLPVRPQQWLAPQPVRAKYVDYDKDELFIEDQSGRVKLVGDAIRSGGPLRSMLITGVVAAVLGTETRTGDFDVVDAVFASLPVLQPAAPISNKKAAAGDDQWVVLMSGMAIGGESALDHHRGQLARATHALRGRRSAQTLRAGAAHFFVGANAGARPAALRPVFAMPVHLLPGERDPASVAIPQQPIHFALLPRAGRFDSLHRHTNPAWLSLGNLKLLGTSGQNIDDIFKYVDEPDSARIDMALRTLEWGHLAPTAPDTLWCYPFKSTDPFVLKDRPDVLFVGNQPSYASAMYTFDPDADDKAQQGCRVVLVPEFARTRQVVLLNLASLDTKLVTIDVPL
ncbi:hypothetical protein L1887_48805 [Cichorium endivia]|nr:hypothetical protein L1887_48805 [Cichorium endivia]